MADAAAHEEEKEKRRKKQKKRTGKLLAKVWQLDTEGQFQDDKRQTADSAIYCLSAIGQKIDEEKYRLGRHGWEDFAKDLGGVFNRHIKRKTKKAAVAKEYLKTVIELLGQKDAKLASLAAESVPRESSAASPSPIKRKSESGDTGSSAKKQRTGSPKKRNKNSELAEREERALNMLENFVEERGGERSQVAGYSSRVTKKSSGKFDVNFYNEEGRRFRSMLEVGRFLKLVNDGGRGAVKRSGFRNKKASSREQEAEKKKLRRELERLRKQLQRATKSLDDFTTDDTDSRYPIDDLVLMDEEASNNGAMIATSTSAVARVPDIDGFPGFPQYCIADILMSWDFVCTFQRLLSVSPIALDDFAAALSYMPPEGQVHGDDVLAPPVYLAEVHLGLLNLLLQDKSSDDWWWSTLESDAQLASNRDLDEAMENEQEGMPVIQVDIASLLVDTEDPLITTSWIKALESVEQGNLKGDAVKRAIRAAMKVASNKWVLAYLRKALGGSKSNGTSFAKRAVVWLVKQVRQARPDMFDRSVSQEQVFAQRAKVVEEVEAQMKALPDTFPTVKDEDIVSDAEEDEDDDSDDSDDEEAEDADTSDKGASLDEMDRPASSIPPKPQDLLLVDFLLPPETPPHNADYVNAFTWSPIVGAAASRILHRRKRVLNEVDDSLRLTRELPPLNVSERRQREKLVAARVLTDCGGDVDEDKSPVEKATLHLCSGGNYLELPAVERLCVLRLLIEAAYDTSLVFDIVDNNYKQRISAMKALDVEQRRAKREAKEKATADEAAAREQLALEARERFLDEKREEIRKLNEENAQFPDDVIESLTEEDIIDFDEDIKEDWNALPTPESFNKTQVNEMIVRMREEAAFDTDALRVLTMEELLQREKRQLEELEGQFQGFGGEDALLDPSLDRETVRSIERLQKDIEKAKGQMDRLPELREKAMEQLRDAMEDGTIKVLRSAVNAARKAKLSGPDDETGGVWAVGLMRDAALELDNAKQNKRVADAQKDLISKRNKCFIRNEPLGYDRFRNRFWTFENEEEGHIWVDAEFTLLDGNDASSISKPPPGFLNLVRDSQSVAVGAEDMEEDLIGRNDGKQADEFRAFSRREYHSSGSIPTLVKHHWGCHATEDSLRAAIKSLDSRGIRERELRNNLKEALEFKVGSGENQDTAKEERTVPEEDDEQPTNNEAEGSDTKDSGDEAVFQSAKEAARGIEDVSVEVLDKISSGIGARVRVRQVISKDSQKDNVVARYETGRVTSWKLRRDEVEITRDKNAMEEEDEDEFEPQTEIVDIPVWQVLTNRGHIHWLTGSELVESISRFDKFNSGRGYFESDSAFLSYRNNLGRYCGRVADAPYCSSPIVFARLMVKREAELYPKLKIRSYDNNWGGKSGSRPMWVNSMKDYAFDFETAKQGLLTLENAFFELTDEFAEYENVSADVPDAKALLADPNTRVEIELESIEKNVPGLWNTPASRAVFIEIVSTCKTTGFLALALDLLCRNTMKYLQRHKLLNVQTSSSYQQPALGRNTRRMNAWQQANQDWY